ncbi:alcohol dehydrogenase catalytic domain-containing protein [Streptomyces sp. NPDC092129]|uniref:alcohol dehydrogenase catalytic domain-containing protein n=1 Tax=Streptomyces sp. NPDC092129 TaxID=3366010 RepID=UPI003830CDFB
MRAAVMYGAGDVRVEDRLDPKIVQPTDAVVRTVAACVCGSDLWPYQSMPAADTGRPMGHEFLGVVEEAGADVTGLTAGDLVVAPFTYSDTPATTAPRACTSRAATVAGTASTASTADRAKPSASRTPTAPW